MAKPPLWSQEEWNEEDEALERASSNNGCTSSSSRSHYSVDPASCPWAQQCEVVETSYGGLNVTICGDVTRPPLLTYHDIGLNHSTCFQGLLLCEETAAILLHSFCVYHLDAPGHEADAPDGDPDDPYMSAEDLADQVAEVAEHYNLQEVACLGVSSGAYVLTLLALRHPKLVKGLVLVSPVCRAATWAEWANMKVLMATLSFYGMARHVKEYLLERYFCQDQSGYHGPGSDSLLSFRRELDERDPESVMRYMSAMHHRQDLTPQLQLLSARVLVVVGALSPFLEEAQHLVSHTDPKTTRYCEVEACGSLVTEERPQAMQDALRSFCRHLVPMLVKGSNCRNSYRTPSSRTHHALSAFSSNSSPSLSGPSTPDSPVSSPFSDGIGRYFVSRSPRVVAFEEISLREVQRRLKPIKTKSLKKVVDSDDEGWPESGGVLFSSTCSSARMAPPESHPVMSPIIPLGLFPATNAAQTDETQRLLSNQ